MKKIDFHESRILQYEMLKEIHRFCTANDICYYLAFGTLLGAIRHQDFIPWDDDVDVIMPYNDFVKFQSIYNSNTYSVYSCLNDNEIGFEFGRLYDERTYGVHGKTRVRGVCVDIYILYGCPQDNLQKFQSYLFNFRERRIKLARIRNFLMNNGLMFGHSCSFAPLNYYCRKYTKYMSHFSIDSGNVAISGIRYYQSREPFRDRILVKFGSDEFYAPRGYDECLKKWYGDYMKLPPVNKRMPYHGFECYWK